MSIQISNSTKISARDNVPEIYIITELHPSHILSTDLSLLSVHITKKLQKSRGFLKPYVKNRHRDAY